MPLCPAIFSRPRGLAGYLEQALLPARGGVHGPVAVWSPEYRNADGSYRDIIGGLAGSPSGVTYYNRVNVTGTLSPNIAADGWEVGGMLNGAPWWKHPTINEFLWFRSEIGYWYLSGALGSTGGATWRATTPTGSFTAYQPPATGTATVAADTSSGVYLFQPSVSETAGPTINQQTARAWGFGGAARISITSDIVGANPFTFCAFVKINGADTFGRLFDNGKTLIFRNGTSINVSNGGATPSTTNAIPNLGEWYFICVTRDSSYLFDVYVNGVLVGAKRDATFTPTASTYMTLGNNNDGTRGLNGDLALPSIHARALSADEIQYLYLAAQKGT